MRMFHHLRLWFFTFNDYLCRVVHSVTCCPIDPIVIPIRSILVVFLIGTFTASSLLALSLA